MAGGEERPFPLPLEGGAPAGTDRRRSGDRRRAGFLSRLNLFKGVPYHLVEDVLAGCLEHSFSEDTVLLAPGSSDENVFLVLSGQLCVHIEEANAARWLEPGAESARSVLVGPGETVGELSTIDGGPSYTFVVALAGSRVLVVDSALFWERLVEVSGVARNLLRLMARRIRQSHETVLAGVRRELAFAHLERELRLAQEIQLSMLPDLAALGRDHAELEAAGIVVPAREVGGDFFDAFFVDPRRLLLAVGDVCGKGVPAALFVTRAMTLLRASGRRLGDPGRVLADLNDLLVEGNESNTFVAMFCALLDLETGELLYTNGGQEQPLVLRASGAVDALSSPGGLVVGAMPGGDYPVARTVLAPGDLLVAFSDGATEANDPAGRLFSPERLESAVAGLQGLSPQGAVESLLAGITAFANGAPASDDITLLTVRFGPVPVSVG
jgi:serine phosphatase RsbU (regulator of sigma subunit)